MSVRTIRAIVVPHTHWDREWYRPFQEYRLRLVQTIDRVLELLQAGRYPYFLLDGQTVVLEDYLAVRPEQEAALCSLIGGGRLGIGPWYVLPDEFLVSGEALVRNLLRGRSLMERFGSPAARVGYLPDMFGHTAQMPQILRKFGLDRAVVWRGLDPEHEHFTWEAPDGTSVPAIFLPEGYHNVILMEDKSLEERVHNVHRFLERHRGFHILFPCGSDHLMPCPDLPDILDQVRSRLHDSTIRIDIGSLEEATEPIEPATTLREELRTPGRAYLLPDVLSTRIPLKQRNARCQTLLERYTEPLAALAWLAGGEYPQGFLREAWRLLLLNHSHDSICGCGIDEVHRENLARFAQVEQLGEGLVRRCIRQLTPRSETPGLFVYNPTGWIRSEWVQAELHWPRDEAPAAIRLLAGDGSAPPFHLLEEEETEVFIGESEKVPDWYPVRRFRVLVQVRDLHPHGFATYKAAEATGANLGDSQLQTRLELMDLQHRLKSLEIRGIKQSPPYQEMLRRQKELEYTLARNALPPVVVDETGLENDLVHLGRDGDRLVLMDKITGHVATDIHFFLDGGDAGDEYNWSPPQADHVVSSRVVDCRPVLQTPALCRWQVEYTLDLPVSLAPDRTRRGLETQELRIVSEFSLAADSRRLEVRSEFFNAHADHRLRLICGTGLTGEVRAWADSAFAVLPRRPTHPADRTPLPVERLQEYRATTFPQQTFTAVEGKGPGVGDSAGSRPPDAGALAVRLLTSPTARDSRDRRTPTWGLAVAVRGLPEAEVIEHEGRWTIAVTLLRAVGWLSRGDLRTRGGQAGPHFPTPGAQCLGPHRCEYALIPYVGSWIAAGIPAEALQFNAPLRGQEFGGLYDFLSSARQATPDWLQVSDPRLMVSAVKRAEAVDALVLRLANPTPEPVEATIRLSGPFQEVFTADLQERPSETSLGNPWTWRWSPYAIETFCAFVTG